MKHKIHQAHLEKKIMHTTNTHATGHEINMSNSRNHTSQARRRKIIRDCRGCKHTILKSVQHVPKAQRIANPMRIYIGSDMEKTWKLPCLSAAERDRNACCKVANPPQGMMWKDHHTTPVRSPITPECRSSASVSASESGAMNSWIDVPISDRGDFWA